jgi:hypothetical protein
MKDFRINVTNVETWAEIAKAVSLASIVLVAGILTIVKLGYILS